MALKFHGAMPVRLAESDAYEMLCLPGDSQDIALKMDGLKKWCPYMLNDESIGACTVNDFLCGGFIDLSTLGVNYFNRFYGNASCSFDEKKIADIVAAGYLMA
ncbi:MAG: hypothetical protein J6R59_02915 [Paludibacteraceae bacterium]|nr:hypothetical protein [Paludibacteraceae bacterium]